MAKITQTLRIMEHPEVTDFIAYLHLKNLAPATIKNYRGVLKRLFDHVALGPSPSSQITAVQLRDYVASLYERGLAAKTIKNYILVMKRFFDTHSTEIKGAIT